MAILKPLLFCMGNLYACAYSVLAFSCCLPKDDLKFLLYYKCQSASTVGILLVKFLYSIKQRKFDKLLSKQSWNKKLRFCAKRNYVGYFQVVWVVPNTKQTLSSEFWENGTSVVRLDMMGLYVNFLVLPTASLSINGNWAMHVGSVTGFYSRSMLFSSSVLKVPTEQSSKLYIQLKFARVAMVFNVIDFFCFWMSWIFTA